MSRSSGRFSVRTEVTEQFGNALRIGVPESCGCPFHCLYCAVDLTGRASTRRRRFEEPGRIVERVTRCLGERGAAESITIGGHGDPTLYTGLGGLIRRLTVHTTLPVVVRTTGVLLTRRSIRRALGTAAGVVLRLDAATKQLFRLMHRPHKGVRFQRHIDGLLRFRDSYRGIILIETVLIDGVNADRSSVERLIRFLSALEPKKVFLDLHTEGQGEASRQEMISAMAEIEAWGGSLLVATERCRHRFDLPELPHRSCSGRDSVPLGKERISRKDAIQPESSGHKEPGGTLKQRRETFSTSRSKTGKADS